QGDGMMDIQGHFDESHDMVWYSKGQIDNQGYSAELQVPLKSIRFPGKKKFTMGILFIRQLMRQSEYASLPVIYPEKGSMLSQSLPVTVSGIKYKRVVELLPAFTSNRESSHREGELKVDDSSSAVSLTAKVGLTPSLTLDAAYNPDFSQVEADAGQVDVNLRYDLFYQEKRPFFLEGDEVFDFSGNTEDGPLVSIVHTRMIADPIFGLKLSGKISRRNTIAAIYAIDEKPSADFTEDAYFSIFRFRHALKNDSYIGAFYTGRDFAGSYNKIIGTDGRFRLSPISVAEYHFLGSTTKGRDEGEKENGHTLGLRYSLSTRKVTLDLGLQDVSKNFRIDSGFFTRTGITRLALLGILRIYPKSKFFQRIEPFYWSFHLYDKYSAMFETFNLFTLRFHMPGQTQFRVDFIAADEVFAGERFDRSGLGFQFYSQLSKYFAAQIFYRYTGAIYYDADSPYQGKGNHVGAFFEYLPAEKFRTSLNLSYVDFYRSADGEKIYDYTLLRSRTTFQLNKYLFFRGIAEYNFFRDELLVDLLASFTYIPGTVIHLGYGSIYEKLQWRNRQYLPADRFLETKRGFFFKVSYLWRL
ncbi:MAG: hypothetical protein KAW12_13665, partial [Candidatus Aminicenantes bacterium]|nr:hypothetical protein [Candidatus Aminicenantes bacterium]